MDNTIRCKACGLVLPEKSLKEVCPACGVPKTSFEPYKDTVSAERRFILNLHLHPIIVHFPQAFSVLIPFLIIGTIIIDGGWGERFQYTLDILSLLLPLSTIAAIATGLIDAKMRFKKYSTPYIRIKIIAGSALFVLSSSLAGFLWGPPSGVSDAVILGISIMCVICNVILGMTGGKLMEAILPGK